MYFIMKIYICRLPFANLLGGTTVVVVVVVVASLFLAGPPPAGFGGRVGRGRRLLQHRRISADVRGFSIYFFVDLHLTKNLPFHMKV